MQNTNEQPNSNKQVSRRGALIILAILCLLSAIIGTTIIKNNQNYNTLSVNDTVIEDRLNAKRMLVDRYESTLNGDSYVKIGGVPIGISVNASGLIVIGQSEVLTEDYGAVYPARNTGLQAGDVIITLNGENLTSIYQLKKILEKIDGAVTLSVNRGGNIFETTITPAVDRLSAQKRLGLMLKEDVGGVGTLTFVTQDGRFGALGHYIADAESGLSYELNSGNIYQTSIDDVIKGERGKAGGLVGNVNRLSDPVGIINQNTDIGIFGDYTADYDGALYKIAAKDEAKVGPAKVFTTIDGTTPRFYDIDIVKVVPQNEAGEKGMVIAVRDKELLEKTGGIVQGMSGSPIIQNGILIGAVTHVFVQDPTRGYAVHSRFMYDYAMRFRSAALYEAA